MMRDDLLDMQHRFPGLRVSYSGRAVRQKRLLVLSGISPPSTVSCFNSSMHNALHAILGRVLCAEQGGVWVPLSCLRPPRYHTNSLESFMTKLCGLTTLTTPYERSEFPMQFRGRKRISYQQAVNALESDGLLPQDSDIRMFLKFEKDVRSDKPGRIPRVISPPGTKFLVELGRFVRKVEHQIYSRVDEVFGSSVVVKGRNADEVGEIIAAHWNSFTDPVALDCDVEKLDRSFDEEMLNWTHRPVKASFSGSDLDLVTSLLATQLKPKVKGRMDDGFFSYTTSGTLTSGQPNTSLAGVLAVCGSLFEVAERTGIKFKVVDAGDDFTVFCERRDLGKLWQGLDAVFKSHGFTLTRSEIRNEIEQIEFCQCHPIKVGVSYRMARNARSAAVKDAASTKPIDQVGTFCGWVNAVGNSGLAMHSGVPVAQSFYNMMIRSAIHQVASLTLSKRKLKKVRHLMRTFELESGGLKYWSKRMSPLMTDITWESRVSYYIAFGVTPTEQLLLEQRYDNTLLQHTNQLSDVDWNLPVHLWG